MRSSPEIAVLKPPIIDTEIHSGMHRLAQTAMRERERRTETGTETGRERQ